MSSVRELHDKAMEFADRATMARAQGDAKRSVEMSAQALDWELAAIAGLSEQGGLAWDVLHRSAGWLAVNSNQFRLAEQLACKALAGEPHPEIAEELRELLDQVYSHMRPQVSESTPAADD
jgi:hypothetical protein